MSPTIITIIVLGLFALYLVALYNSLVRLNNRTKEAWSDIDVQLKRRHDLIPNLVESVKGYLKHERELLENVARLRANAISAQEGGNRATLSAAETALSGALGRLTVAMEAYPDLKASQNVNTLMDELSDTENKIQASRRFYNSQARDFNTKIESFPANLVSKVFSFTKYAFFEVEDQKEKENIKVSLS